MIGFGFFDEAVSTEGKQVMGEALKKDGSEGPPKRIMPFVEPMTKQLHDIFTKSTRWFFKMLRLLKNFWRKIQANG